MLTARCSCRNDTRADGERPAPKVRSRRGSAAPAGPAPAAVAEARPRPALEAALVLLRARHAQPERGRSRPLVPDPDVVDLRPALHLAPAVGEQMLVPPRGVLAELVGVRHLEIEALDADFLVVGH